MDKTLAHNTWFTNGTIPVIIEDDTYYPFAPGERETEWHEASDSEYLAYEAYWDEHHE